MENTERERGGGETENGNIIPNDEESHAPNELFSGFKIRKEMARSDSLRNAKIVEECTKSISPILIFFHNSHSRR